MCFSQVVSIRARIHIRRVKRRTLQRATRSANGFNQIVWTSQLENKNVSFGWPLTRMTSSQRTEQNICVLWMNRLSHHYNHFFCKFHLNVVPIGNPNLCWPYQSIVSSDLCKSMCFLNGYCSLRMCHCIGQNSYMGHSSSSSSSLWSSDDGAGTCTCKSRRSRTGFAWRFWLFWIRDGACSKCGSKTLHSFGI